MRTAIFGAVILSALIAALLFSIGLGVSFLHALLVILGIRFAIVAVTYNGVTGGTYASVPDLEKK